MADLPPNAPKLRLPGQPKRAKNRISTHDRGYGIVHQKMRKVVFAEQGGICAICKNEWCQSLNHKDGNTKNVKRENLEGCCNECHKQQDSIRRNGGKVR